MAITINIYYTGTGGAAHKFAQEMLDTGVVSAIRAEEGNLRYDYFFPMDDPETLLLIDSWADGAYRRFAGEVRPSHEGGTLH